MPGTVVVGTQWGDEGKGKLIDLLAAEADVVVRCQGGHNAGHTVVVGQEKFAIQLIPSGVLHPGVTPVIGNGVVVDPAVLFAEMEMFERRGVDTSRLRVSGNAHLILPYHAALDGLAEARRGDASIGTTRRGIGPAYADKAAREGLRVQDLLHPEWFRARLEAVLGEKNAVLTHLYGHEPYDVDAICDVYLGEYAPRIAPFVADAVALVHEALDAGKRLLLEGAQATFLDLDHGTYPYVTSSNPIVSGMLTGCGVGPLAVQRIIGVAKAYVTRVGMGPVPTELHDAVGDVLVERGREFGTNTGRRRRTGWFDAVMVRHAARLNSLTELAITKLDVLDTLDTIKVCVAYEIDGERVEHLPADRARFASATPVYEALPGWQSDLSEVRRLSDLPSAARAYLDRLGEITGVPITYLFVGPEREQVVEVAA